MQKPILTPKAVIHKIFGSQACYKVEEVMDSTELGCPGLVITQKGPCLYRCSLQLPEISVVSGTFKKKKEAEQSAAELALEKVYFIVISIIATTNSHFLIFHTALIADIDLREWLSFKYKCSYL